MTLAKHRERKCSTCKHYQPSPLWRKGWCRNPLLYDRNTNHLVEADSLSCNRTFIDYWEPMEGPAQEMGPQPRSPKPRIAPSIPIGTVDAKGRRKMVTGNTPVGGMAAVVPQDIESEEAPKPTGISKRASAGRERPALSVVTPDYDQVAEPSEGAAKETQLIEEIEGPEAYEPQPLTTAERIRRARAPQQITLFGYSFTPLYLVLAALIAVSLVAGGLLLRNRTVQEPGVLPIASPSAPQPTPTGFGDPTATVAVPPTVALPPAGTIGINGWVEVRNTRTGLVVRSEPNRSASRIMVIGDGTKAHVIDGPRQADGFTWWKVDNFNAQDRSASGWCAGQFLTPIPPP